MLLAVVSCRRQAPEASGPRGTAENPYIVGFSQCTLNEPWRVEMNRQIQLAADQHPEIKLLMSNAEDKSERQVNDVENFLAQGVDLLIISPKEAAPLTDIVAKVYNQGIPVVVLDRKVLGDEFSCFIGADNQKIGHQAGLKAKELLADGGTIVELTGNMSSTPGEERQRGFREAIGEDQDHS
jgi:ribose transport system substrate-binding protein